MRKIFAGMFAAAVLFSMSGCTPPAPGPFITKPDCSLHSGVADKWRVSFRGEVTVEEDKDGVVHVYGIARSPNTSTVVLRGTAKFKVHSCDVVYLEEGVTADCYGCADVRASNKTTVNAYNCRQVRATNGAKVSPYGDTNLTTQPAPQPPPAQEPPANKN